MNTAPITPRYKHDCSCCHFLGYKGNADLYYHPTEPVTLIARYSNDGPHYSSGFFTNETNEDLIAAKQLAINQGYIKKDNIINSDPVEIVKTILQQFHPADRKYECLMHILHGYDSFHSIFGEWNCSPSTIEDTDTTYKINQFFTTHNILSLPWLNDPMNHESTIY